MQDDLGHARERVAAAEAYLEDQRQIIASLAAYKQDTSHAEKLLHTMEAVLRALQEHVVWMERRQRSAKSSSDGVEAQS